MGRAGDKRRPPPPQGRDTQRQGRWTTRSRRPTPKSGQAGAKARKERDQSESESFVNGGDRAEKTTGVNNGVVEMVVAAVAAPAGAGVRHRVWLLQPLSAQCLRYWSRRRLRRRRLLVPTSVSTSR